MSAALIPWHASGRAQALRAAALLVGSVVARLQSSVTRLERVAGALAARRAWHGPAAESAGAALARRLHGIRSAALALDLARAVLDRTAVAVASASARATRAASRALALPALLAHPALAAIAASALVEDELELRDAALTARLASTTCAGVLHEAAQRCRAVVRGTEGSASRADVVRQLGRARASVWLATVPAVGTTVGEVARWWSAHTPGEQSRLISDPATAARVGALDGLPAAARDRANRAVLARRLASWAAHAAAAGAATARAIAAHGVDLRVLDELGRVHLDPLSGKPVPALLLTYAPAAWGGRGRVALAFGSPDAADHVAFVVPGLGSRADPGLADLSAGAWALYTTARRLVSRPTVATVAWLGYESPDLPEVAFEGRARAGAARLAADLTGLRAARGDDQPHITVVGHSYGSLVGALSTRLLPGCVDDLALIGSPGVAVDHADQLPVQDGHVWVGAASADPVSHLSAFGVDPAARSFGAHRFPAEAGGAVRSLAQHTSYLIAGSASLAALARIAAGRGADVPAVPGRTDGGFAGAAVDLLLRPVLPPVLGRFPDPTLGDPAVGSPRS